MKKFLIILAMILTLPLQKAFCVEVNTQTNEAKIQKQIMEIGFNILNANKIDKRVTFYYKSKVPMINAYASYNGRTVGVYKGMMSMCDNEDELASILAHEIAHQLDFHKGLKQLITMNFTPRKYEYKADKVGVDLMVKAGYNPIAMITTSVKMDDYKSTFSEVLSTHPKGTKRMMEVYERIYTKYPQYLADNEYKDNVYYQNFLLLSQDNRKRLEQKLKNPKGTIVEVRYR